MSRACAHFGETAPMKTFALTTALSLAALFGAPAMTSAQDQEPSGALPKLVTVVTSADAQTQAMALVLTLQAMKQGTEARLLLCGPAGDLALADALAVATAPLKPKGATPQGLLKAALASGAVADVCALYLPNKGLHEDALLNGVGTAKPDAMVAHLMADNARVLSF